jgi:dihydropyrimidine dehydrogenase (NAD+) subunit PreA
LGKYKGEKFYTTVAGVEFVNPFILGCGPPTRDAERIIRAAKMGWAGAVHKTVVIPPTKDPTPRIGVRSVDGLPFANENIELLTTYPPDQWEKWVLEIKEKAPSDFILISSIMGNPDPESWKEPLLRMQDAGTDMVELNISCPHGSPEQRQGAYIGQDAELTAEITSFVKKHAKVPVIVKFTPNVTDIKPIAKAAEQAGADAYTVSNSHGPGILGVDIYKEEPLPSVKGYSSPGGISGPVVKPFVLKLITEVIQTVKNPEIFGLGGVTSWYDAVEHMMVGAKAVQIVTGVLWYGYGIIDRLMDGLTKFIDEKGFEGVNELVGRVLPKVIAHSDLSFEEWGAAFVDPEACISCCRCLDPCKDAAGGALYFDAEAQVVRSNPEDCIGCGLCTNICPAGAIELLPKEEAEKKYQQSLTARIPSISSRLHRYYEREYVDPMFRERRPRMLHLP